MKLILIAAVLFIFDRVISSDVLPAPRYRVTLRERAPPSAPAAPLHKCCAAAIDDSTLLWQREVRSNGDGAPPLDPAEKHLYCLRRSEAAAAAAEQSSNKNLLGRVISNERITSEDWEQGQCN